MSSDVIEMPNVKAERAREAMLSELDGGTIQLRSVVDLDKYIAALAEIREQREECERLHTELAEAKAGREAERVARRELARDLTATDRERVQFRQERDAALARAEQSFIDGRTAERADVVDWLRYPPGRVPDGALLLVGELWMSIVAGAHESRDSKALERLTAHRPIDKPDALARIDTLSDEQLEAEAAQAMAERPEPHGDCEGCIEVDE